YRCCACRRTFRHYPPGSSRADQTERLKSLAVICWTLGLSYRSVSRILSGLNVRLSQMSVWRDAQAQAQALRKHNHWRKVRVLGVDGALVRGWGGLRPVLVAVDLGEGEVVALGPVDERDPHAVGRWLQGLVQRLGVGVIVTDDLYIYRIVSEQLQLGHQVCQFHVRRWVGKVLKGLQETVPKEWQWVLGEVQELIEFLPPEGDHRLYALWKQVSVRRSGRSKTLSALDQLRDLLLRLSQRWASYCTFQGEPQVPWTNNATEQAIGGMKMRARSVRGYKSWQGMQTGLLLTGAHWF
ncbi:MAG TPA: transposase, partial [Candidatus Methylomirabilis sp.]|nr:transposase [Candidatus Methylomirabilis sp.]